MTKVREISNTEDVIDLRDVIARFEDLEGRRDVAKSDEAESGADNIWTAEDGTEFNELADYSEDDETEYHSLLKLLDECRGNGGDEQWRGDWYPITLVRDSHFRDYAEELAEDIGAISKDATWPNNFIDWDAASEALKQDYTTVDFDGVDYWVR